MNPTIDEGLIQRELERDPEGAQAEWLATFRTDLAGRIFSRIAWRLAPSRAAMSYRHHL